MHTAEEILSGSYGKKEKNVLKLFQLQDYCAESVRSHRVYYQRCNVYMMMIQPTRDVPPDYYTVVKMEEDQLPSYQQAVARANDNIFK